MSYESESAALDLEVLGIIDAWHYRGEMLDDARFNDLALRLFLYQLRYNAPYARYCARLGITESNPPQSWERIPPVPAASFKDVASATFDPKHAALTFETSGTTSGRGGRHYLETPALYDAALLAGFDRFMLADAERLRYLNLVPNPVESPRSSLGYMMGRVAEARGDGATGWYLHRNELLIDEFLADARRSAAENQPVCIAATAFALVHVLEAMEERGLKLALASGSRIMETGGFKGRARSVDRDELYERACERFGVSDANIVSEYGMTELTSQHYDADRSAKASQRRKTGPPWLRARVVGPDRATLPKGAAGALVHVDLANRASCIAVQTEDVGIGYDDGFVLLGRNADAERRGCSLDAEDLAVSASIAWM